MMKKSIYLGKGSDICYEIKGALFKVHLLILKKIRHIGQNKVQVVPAPCTYLEPYGRQQVYDHRQDQRFPRLCFFAQKDIKPGEELCYDYGWDVLDSDNSEGNTRIKCHCGSPKCKKFLSMKA